MLDGAENYIHISSTDSIPSLKIKLMKAMFLKRHMKAGVKLVLVFALFMSATTMIAQINVSGKIMQAESQPDSSPERTLP